MFHQSCLIYISANFIDVNLNEVVPLKRVHIAKAISTVCDERTPPMLLWASGRHIEAIFYCDQFRDLKSQAMLRFLEEQLSGFILAMYFAKIIFILIAFFYIALITLVLKYSNLL